MINKIRASINATNDTLKAAASVDPLPLAEKIWQDLWAVSGATPENCLYTFVEIFILTYIDTFDYDGKYMTWSTNGFAGTILVLDGKFSINGDRGVLIPKDGRTDIDLDYMKFTLEPLFRDLAKGRKGDNGEDEFTKLYPSMLNDIMIPVPVDEHGSIDLCAQKEIATKYLAIERSKDEVVSKLDALIQQKIEL